MGAVGQVEVEGAISWMIGFVGSGAALELLCS